MNNAIATMLARYNIRHSNEAVRALREILQEIALLGLWRSKFFEHAAFYGGTALRLLYGLDRFSEDLDFTLLTSDPAFSLRRYNNAVRTELAAFGFDASVEEKEKENASRIQSAFLKVGTLEQLLRIGIPSTLTAGIPAGKLLSIRFEVDVDPPSGFETDARFIFQPVPFSVRTLATPDLFAGKMHAVLFRKWKNRVKGRDWYDLVWYAARHPKLRLRYLENRMVQSGDWETERRLDEKAFRALCAEAVDRLDVARARSEVEPFVSDPASLAVWSPAFFHAVMSRIVPMQ